MAIEPTDTPVIDPKVGGPSGTTRSTPFLPDSLDAKLDALLSELERANPPPKPLTRTQDIGAGLMRIGNALSGRDPSIQSGPERELARREELYQAGKQRVTGLRISDAYKRREEEQAAKAREEAQARLNADIAERQRVDDERAAQRSDHEKGMSLIDGLLPQPGFVLPDEETLGSMTHAKAQAISQAYWQSKGVEPQAANFATWAKSQQEQMGGGMRMSATQPFPGGKGGSVTFSTPEEKGPDVAPADKPVSVGTMGRADRIGIKLAGTESEIEASNMIADKQALDREKRFGKLTPRNNKVYDEIVDWLALEDAANRALSFGNEYGGPYQGSPLSTIQIGLQDWYYKTDELAKKYQYNGLVAKVASAERKLTSGAAVTPQEGAWMAPRIPTATDLDTKRKENLAELASGARRAYLGRAQFAGLTDDDLAEIRKRMFGGLPPLPTQPGDVLIGDSY